MKKLIEGFADFFKDGTSNSMSRLALFISLLVASTALIMHAMHNPLSELLLASYLAPFAGAYGWAKSGELKRDAAKEDKDVV